MCAGAERHAGIDRNHAVTLLRLVFLPKRADNKAAPGTQGFIILLPGVGPVLFVYRCDAKLQCAKLPRIAVTPELGEGRAHGGQLFGVGQVKFHTGRAGLFCQQLLVYHVPVRAAVVQELLKFRRVLDLKTVDASHL